MNKFRAYWNRIQIWLQSRSNRKARRAAESVADTTAAGVGGVLRLALRAVVTVLLVVVTTGILFTCIFAVYVKTCLNTELDVSLEEMSLSQSSTIWYQDENDTWQELATLYAEENRVWADYEDMPIYLEYATVAIEDKRFYEHKGVDWYRTVAAFANMFLSMSDSFGGSTITQQLIKNVTKEDDVTVQRKLLEIFRALEFEKIYTKQEIMTWYLNVIYLGEGCYGVQAAANVYFGKDVWDLSLAECACLVGITNNPSKYDPYWNPENCLARRNTILWEMYDQGYINYDQYTQAVNEPITLALSEDDTYVTPVYSYYVDTIIRDVMTDLMERKDVSALVAKTLLYNGGYNIYACIDMRIQNIVDNVYENTYNLPSSYRTSSQQLQSAIVIIDPYNGDIVALSGGVGEKAESLSLNRATQSKRPPGSSIKPIAVYAPALDLGLITPSTSVNDTPSGSLSGTTWYPKNSGNTYLGWITVHDALVYSKNTVAAQILDKLGLQTSYEYLTEHFGVTSLVVDDGTGATDLAYAPLSLGQLSYGITVREMAQAYTAFVNDGIMSYGRTYSLITDQSGNIVLDNSTKQLVAVKANTAWNIANLLEDAVSYGTGTAARIYSTAVGGKTGTTSDDKDRYFVGITGYYVAAVWTGYDTPEQMYFYNNPACLIWKDVMSSVLAGFDYLSFKDGVGGSSTNLFGSAETPSPTPEETPEPTTDETTPEPTLVPVETPTPSPSTVPATATPAPTTAPVTEAPVPATTPPAVNTPQPDPTPNSTPDPTPEPTIVPMDGRVYA